jgi:hypothetical protein
MMKNLYGDQCMRHIPCYEWFKRFKDGWQSTRGITFGTALNVMLRKFVKLCILIVV